MKKIKQSQLNKLSTKDLYKVCQLLTQLGDMVDHLGIDGAPDFYDIRDDIFYKEFLHNRFETLDEALDWEEEQPDMIK